MKIEKEGEFQVLVEGERYRCCSITKMDSYNIKNTGDIETIKIVNLPISYGLAIEQKCEDNSYIVVAYVKWDDLKNQPVFEPVDFRAVETLDVAEKHLIDEYYNTVMFAKGALQDLYDSFWGVFNDDILDPDTHNMA